VHYTSDIDTITFTHEAKSRDGFALGAVMAAEWLPGKAGSFGMRDVLDL
jgi:4-hydroxy-tetrahydrodipicolinate reductase